MLQLAYFEQLLLSVWVIWSIKVQFEHFELVQALGVRVTGAISNHRVTGQNQNKANPVQF